MSMTVGEIIGLVSSLAMIVAALGFFFWVISQ